MRSAFKLLSSLALGAASIFPAAAKPSDAIPKEDLIPLNALITITRRPAKGVVTFYNESERLVRFLAATDKPSFLALLDAVAGHQPLKTILPRLYAGRFANVSILEEQFRDYASKEASLQQATND
jgi:hypothetical protein